MGDSVQIVGETVASKFPVEFVISVTGHRDLVAEDLAGLRHTAQGVLAGVASRFSRVPVRLVTGLAEGADTIAAEAALEAGLPVTAVLPMPRQSYEADFEGEALERFRALADDDRVEVLEMPLAGGLTEADLADTNQRDRQYAMLGDYIIRRSNLVLALWDGEVTGLQGGTSDVALGYLARRVGAPIPKVPRDDALLEDVGQVVVWVPSRRRSGATEMPAPEPSFLISNTNNDCYWESGSLPAAVSDRWHSLDEAAAIGASGVGADLPAYGLADGGGTEAEQQLNAAFIRADQIARANQAQSDRMFKIFGLLAAAMGLFFLVYAKLLAARFLLVLYVAVFVLGFIGFRISARRHWLGRHLAYRVLAETLRVQFFLVLSGAGKGCDLL